MSNAKIGLHCLNTTDSTHIVPMATRLYNNGTPIPALTFVNRLDLVAAIKNVSPSTIVLNRIEGGANPDITGGDPYSLGKQYFKQWYTPSLADFTQVRANEWGKDGRSAQASFYCGMMQAANDRGVKITVGDYSVGSIEPNEIALIQPMLIAATIGRHALNYHSYLAPNTDDVNKDEIYYDFRWVQWLKNFPSLTVFCGETGTFDPTFHTVDRTMSIIDGLQNKLELLASTGDGILPKIINNVFMCVWSEGFWNIDQGKSEIDSINPAYEVWVMKKGKLPVGGIINPNPVPTSDPDEFLRDLKSVSGNIKDDDRFVLGEFLPQIFPGLVREGIITGNRLKQMLSVLTDLVSPNDLYNTLVDQLHVRDNPSTSGKILTTIQYAGTALSIVRGSEKVTGEITWVQIAGTTQWVAKSQGTEQYLKLVTP